MTESSPEIISEGERPAGDRLTIFRSEDGPELDATDMMTPPEIEQAILDEFDLSQLAAGSKVKVLFRQAGEEGHSLVYAWFGPNYQLPRHSHSADCLYYVISGEAVLGSQVVKAGSGFFVPADQLYGYRAGPEGVEVLEFRKATSFDMQIADKKRERWLSIMGAAAANQQVWAETRPD
jgi:hypothetical protein